MKTRILTLTIILMLSANLLGACLQSTPAVSPTDTPAGQGAGLPNPASANCEQMGGKVDIRTTEDGSQSGVCVFPDGSECDEWLLFREECSPKSSAPDDVILPAPGSAGETPDALNQVASVAKNLLAEQLKIDQAGIVLAGMEEKTWPDACLGLAKEGEMCDQVETPGYLITLTVGDTRYTFRSDLAGENVRPEPVG